MHDKLFHFENALRLKNRLKGVCAHCLGKAPVFMITFTMPFVQPVNDNEILQPLEKIPSGLAILLQHWFFYGFSS